MPSVVFKMPAGFEPPCNSPACQDCAPKRAALRAHAEQQLARYARNQRRRIHIGLTDSRAVAPPAPSGVPGWLRRAKDAQVYG